MSSGLPAGFVDLQTASDRLNEDLNIMGVVVDFLPPTRSRGTDYMSTFSLADSAPGGYEEHLKVRYFRPMQSEHPSIQGTGDVVILRAVRVTLWSGMKVALSSFNTAWTVFPAAAIPESAGLGNAKITHNKSSRMPAPTVAEILHAINLCNSQDRSSFTTPIQPGLTSDANSSVVVSSPAVGRRDKFSLIKDVKIDSFYDVVGQVIRKHSGNGRCELYLTDYTSNNLLYNYEWGRSEEEGIARDGDEHGYLPKHSKNRDWPGPYGKMTLQVALWAPHSYFAMQSVKDADWIHLRNLRVKLGQNGTLEGSLHTDNRYPERIDVTILKDHDDDRVKEVIRRKRDYWAKAKAQSSELVELTRGQKRKQAEGAEEPLKGRGKKRKKQQQHQHQYQHQHPQQQHASREIEPTKPRPLDQLDRHEPNKHIRSNSPAIPTTPLHTILTTSSHETTTPSGTTYRLPFQNICTRAHVRAVDFFPKDLADFTVPCRVSEYDVLSDNDSDSADSADENRRQWDDGHGWGGATRWEWRFYLLLEDAKGVVGDGEKARLRALVAGEDAVMLLKMDAENLRTNPTALATLHEKLFILWGDLEERHAASTSALQPRDLNRNQLSAVLDRKAQGDCKAKGRDAAPPGAKPFVCCLKEYGVKAKVKGERGFVRERGEPEGEERGGKGKGGEGKGGQKAVDAEGWERRWRVFGTVIM